MVKKVGIPRSLFYYKYYPLWNTFFKELGVEVILSAPSTKKILDDGIRTCVDEACLPVKLFHGHVLDIKDRVDYLFIPRFTSISKNEYICPKMGGLPDMVWHSIKNLPPVLDVEINLRKSNRNAWKAAMDVGTHFCSSKREIRRAFSLALKNYYAFREKTRQGYLAADLLEGRTTVKRKKNVRNTLRIVVLGHEYNLNDSFINLNLLQKLKNKGAEVITLDMLDEAGWRDSGKIVEKKMFWNFGRKVLDCIPGILERGDVDGLIYLMSFGCGVDSFISDLVGRRVHQKESLPFMILTLDEHSGEAGLDTRLEAFLDMIAWRKSLKEAGNGEKNEDNLSAYGEYVYNSEGASGRTGTGVHHPALQ